MITNSRFRPCRMYMYVRRSFITGRWKATQGLKLIPRWYNLDTRHKHGRLYQVNLSLATLSPNARGARCLVREGCTACVVPSQLRSFIQLLGIPWPLKQRLAEVKLYAY